MPLNRYDGVIKYGVAYGKACDIVICIIMNEANKVGQDIENWDDEYKRFVCLDCWGKFILETENNELFYQGQKL